MTPESFPEANETYAKDQPQYRPLPVRKLPDGTVTSFWSLSDEEMELLVNSERPGIYVTQLTFNRPLQPLLVSLDLPPACFEANAELKDIKLEGKPPAQPGVEGLKDQLGRSAPMCYAMDADSIPGKIILHEVQFQSYALPADSRLDKLLVVKPGIDRRLDFLAAMFGSGSRKGDEALIQLLKVLAITMDGLELALKSPGLPPPVKVALQQIHATAEQAIKTGAA